jgi:hypothetical protein
MLCAKQLVEIAGVIPQATPTTPAPLAPLHDNNGHAEDARSDG